MYAYAVMVDQIMGKLEVIQNALQDCRKNVHSQQDLGLAEVKKENIPPTRRTSMATQEHSILGTIQIDMSQERTTQKATARRPYNFQNELTDRSISKSRSKSNVNNVLDPSMQTSFSKLNDRSNSNIINNHFISYQSPTQSVKKTKLTLVQPQQSLRTNLSSQLSQKNPLLSPTLFGGHSSQRFLDIDQSISVHVSINSKVVICEEAIGRQLQNVRST